MQYETKIASLIVKPVGEDIFSEQATTIGIDDDGAGIFYTIQQDGGNVDNRKILITQEEWPVICAAVERLIAEWG